MPIQFQCSKCQSTLRVPDETAGREAKCPECGSIVPIPTLPAGSVAPPPAWPAPPPGPGAAPGVPPPPPSYGAPSGYGVGKVDPAAAQNPYRSPRDYAAVDLTSASRGLPLASRWARLLGAIVDSIIGSIAVAPIYVAMMPDSRLFDDEAMAVVSLSWIGIGGLLMLAVQGYLVSTRGQSIGKMVLGTRIVDYATGANPGFVRAFVVRWFVVSLLSSVPCIGGIFWFVNVLWIFGDERRCLHDLMASTIVVRADAVPPPR